MRRLLAVLCCILIFSCNTSQGCAGDMLNRSDDRLSLRYTNITSIFTLLSIRGGTAACQGCIEIDAPSNMTVALTVRLQRSSNGISWTNIDVWTATGKNQATVSGQKTLSTGYYYRTYVYGRVLDENGTRVESAVKYSSVKEY